MQSELDMVFDAHYNYEAHMIISDICKFLYCLIERFPV